MTSPTISNSDTFVNAAAQPAGTIGPFRLQPGRYAVVVTGSGTISTTLQLQAGDGSFVNAAAAITAAGLSVLHLPGSMYQIVFGGSSSANYCSVSRVAAI